MLALVAPALNPVDLEMLNVAVPAELSIDELVRTIPVVNVLVFNDKLFIKIWLGSNPIIIDNELALTTF